MGRVIMGAGTVIFWILSIVAYIVDLAIVAHYTNIIVFAREGGYLGSMKVIGIEPSLPYHPPIIAGFFLWVKEETGL